MSGQEQSPVDFTTLKELLGYIAVFGIAVICGYPACCLVFPEKKWDKYSRYKQGILSVAVGSGFIVLGWSLIVYIGTTTPEYSELVKGNQVILTTALLCVIAMIEVFLMAISIFARKILRKRKRRGKESQINT